MIQILPLANILQEEMLLEDDFKSKFEGREIIEDEDKKSFKKIQVLKKMLDAGLISCKEYAVKKEEILKLYV